MHIQTMYSCASLFCSLVHHRKRPIVKPPVYWVGVSNMQCKWAEQMWSRAPLPVLTPGWEVLPTEHDPCFRQRVLSDFLLLGGSMGLFMQGTLGVTNCMSAGFPGRSESTKSACVARDRGSVPGPGRSPRGGDGSTFQYSCLEKPMDRGASLAVAHGAAGQH